MRIIIALLTVAFASPAFAQDAPQFRPEPFWPKPLPDNWILGQVVRHRRRQQRPRLDRAPAARRCSTTRRARRQNPPQTNCCTAAPAVMEFDADGNLLRPGAGPGARATTGRRTSTASTSTRDGNVWLGGNGERTIRS